MSFSYSVKVLQDLPSVLKMGYFSFPLGEKYNFLQEVRDTRVAARMLEYPAKKTAAKLPKLTAVGGG